MGSVRRWTFELVRAVLGPHRRVHRELDRARVAPERLADQLELLVAEPELPVQRLRGRVHAHRTPAIAWERSEAKQRLPAGRADVGVHRVLRVGHQAHDVARLVANPGDARSAPFGLWASVTSPLGPQ